MTHDKTVFSEVIPSEWQPCLFKRLDGLFILFCATQYSGIFGVFWQPRARPPRPTLLARLPHPTPAPTLDARPSILKAGKALGTSLKKNWTMRYVAFLSEIPRQCNIVSFFELINSVECLSTKRIPPLIMIHVAC